MNVFKGLLNNATLMLFLVFLLGETKFRYEKRRLINQIIVGFIIGIFGILIMMTPFEISKGSFYDTRSILLSMSGVFFGPLSTIISAIMMIIYRAYVGGPSVIAGILSILSSTIMGILWKKYRYNRHKNHLIIEFYLFGLINTILVLFWQLIPDPDAGLIILKDIWLPIIIIFPIATVIVAIVFTNHIKQIKANDMIKQSELLLNASIEGIKDVLVVSLDKNYNYLFFNKSHEQLMKKMFNVNIEKGKNFFSYFTIKQERDYIKSKVDKALKGASFSDIHFYGINRDQYLNTYYGPIYDENNNVIGVTAFSLEITSKLLNERKLEASEEKNRLLIKSMNQGLAVFELLFDNNQNVVGHKIIDVNESYENITETYKEDLIGKSISDVFSFIEPSTIEKMHQVALTKVSTEFEDYLAISGKYLLINVFSPQKNQFAVMITDITERKLHEEKIRYINYHDYLTGLYNRRYYDEELARLTDPKYLPVTVVMADINGLKLVNDAFGHAIGDKLIISISDLLKKHFRAKDVISRIGGDEFVVLMPNTDISEASRIIETYNDDAKDKKIFGVSISISFGMAMETKKVKDLNYLVNLAEKEMYNNKIYELSSNRSKIIQTILNTLYLINPREELHSRRVSELCQDLGKAYGLKVDQLQLLKTAAILHDVGKIAVDDKILNKPTSLTPQEWDEVRRHPEIGYRILSTSSEYNEIAEDILCHHEAYNGTGYPKGLKGEQIPWRSRVITICDAFDAMTSFRPYRESLSYDQAIEELIKGKGTQFDPILVNIFIEKVLKKTNKAS